MSRTDARRAKNSHGYKVFRDSAPLLGKFLRRMIAHPRSSCEAASHGISTQTPSTNPVEILLRSWSSRRFLARIRNVFRQGMASAMPSRTQNNDGFSR
jgi:hypothetical protein